MDWLRTFQTPPEGYVCREARPEDGLAIENVIIENEIWGGTMEKDGEPVAYAGVNKINGRHWVFLFIKDDEIRKHGLWLVRIVRETLRELKGKSITEVYALCDATKPRAPEFLTALGFRPIPAIEKPADIITYELLMGAKAWRWRS